MLLRPVPSTLVDLGDGTARALCAVLRPAGTPWLADALVATKQAVRERASAAGLSVSFMPRPFDDEAGSGLHLHQRIDDLVFDAGGSLSPDGRAVVAGLLDLDPGPRDESLGGFEGAATTVRARILPRTLDEALGAFLAGGSMDGWSSRSTTARVARPVLGATPQESCDRVRQVGRDGRLQHAHVEGLVLEMREHHVFDRRASKGT